MSMTTENFKFFKPELSDPADITELNANWDRIDNELANAGIRIVAADSTDGINYTANVPYLTDLYTGLEITIIPSMTSSMTNPTLNVNGFGAKNIKVALSTNTSATTTPKLPTFFAKGKAVKLMYDEDTAPNGIWKTVDKQRTSGSDLYGIVPVENGGTGADNAVEARQNLGAIAVQPFTVTLTAAGWSNNKQTVSANGVKADNVVVITHAPNSYSNYKDYCVRCIEQGTDTLTFECDVMPTVEITANVVILE